MVDIGSEIRRAFLSKDIAQMRRHHAAKVKRVELIDEKKVSSFKLPEIILGGQDGLVNVLGIILGVGVATASTHLVIVAGVAAAFAESVSMAAVAYTSRLAEADYYQSEMERERWEIEHYPEGEEEEVRYLYESYGFKGKVLDDIVKTITADKDIWVRVMMEQELKLEPIDRKAAFPAAFVVGISAIVGSFIPLFPFFIFPNAQLAMMTAIIISAVTLFSVGYYKAKTTLGRHLLAQGTEMMVIGMMSAFVGYLIGLLFKV